MLLDSELGPRVRIPTLLPTFRLQRAPRRPPSVPLQPELHRSLLPSPGPAERACPALRSPLVPNREAISKVINIHCAGPASPDRVALLLALTQLPRAAEGHRGSPQPQSLPGARRDHAARAAPLPRAPGQPLPRRPRVLCTGRIDVKQRRIPGEGRETLMPPLHTLPERKPNKLQVPVHRGAFPGSEKKQPRAPEPRETDPCSAGYRRRTSRSLMCACRGRRGDAGGSLPDASAPRAPRLPRMLGPGAADGTRA